MARAAGPARLPRGPARGGPAALARRGPGEPIRRPGAQRLTHRRARASPRCRHAVPGLGRRARRDARGRPGRRCRRPFRRQCPGQRGHAHRPGHRPCHRHHTGHLHRHGERQSTGHARLPRRRRPSGPSRDRPGAVGRRRARLRAPGRAEGAGRASHPDRLHRRDQHGRRGGRPVRERDGRRRDGPAPGQGEPGRHRLRRGQPRGPAAKAARGRGALYQRPDARLRQERLQGPRRAGAGQPPAGAAGRLDRGGAGQPALRPPADPVPRDRHQPAQRPHGSARPRLAAARDPRQHGHAGPVLAHRDRRRDPGRRRPGQPTCRSAPHAGWAPTW